MLSIYLMEGAKIVVPVETLIFKWHLACNCKRNYILSHTPDWLVAVHSKYYKRYNLMELFFSLSEFVVYTSYPIRFCSRITYKL